jgi:protein-L-isoaspartate(D-aspartate) O-methyltransferase
MDIEQARFYMIEQQLRPAEVLDPAALEAVSLVRRERFVAPAQQALAFADVALPLPGGRKMLTPIVAGRLLQAAAPKRGENVLLIGTGSGYLAALLAVHATSVRVVEADPVLVSLARANLAHAGVANVTVEEADGLQGDAAHGPYDLIVASGAVREVPAAWLTQLKPGGRLLACVGSAPVLSVRLYTPAGGSRALFETSVDALRTPAAAFAF